MEKQITIKNIHAHFEKNFDTFGKMDPFLIFKFANSQGKTSIAKGAGLQASWSQEIKLTAVDESEVVQVVAYDEDITENEYIGTANFNINELKIKDQLSINFFDSQNKIIGWVSFTFTIEQSLKYDYTIQVWQIKAIYDQNFDTFSTMEPFLVFSHEDQKFRTQIVQNVNIGQTIEFKKNKFCFGFNEETQKEQKLKRYKQLKIEGYQDDLTDEQYVGKAYIVLQKLLKGEKGYLPIKLNGQDTKVIGTVFFNYFITCFKKSTVQQTLLRTVQQKRNFYPAKSLIPQKQDLPSTQLDIISKQDTLKQDFPQKKINISNKVKIPPKVDDPKKTNPSNKNGAKSLNPKKQDIPPTQAYISNQDPQKFDIQQQGINITQPINPSQQVDSNSGEETQKEKVQRNPQLTSQSHSTIKSGIIEDGEEVIKTPEVISPVVRHPNPVKNTQKKIYFHYLGLNIKDSAFTLQRSIKSISIGKEKRFKSTQKNTAETYRHDTCFQPNKGKGVGFGFGSKIQISAMTSRKLNQYPGPDSYFRESRTFSVNSKGTIFAKQQRFDPKAVILKSLISQNASKPNFRIKFARKTN